MESNNIQVLYARYYCVYLEDFDDIKEALSYIESGSDNGDIYPIGVFIDKKPHIWNGYITQDKPTPEQEETMIENYSKAKNE